jgi:hypothetical protein
MLDHLRQKAAQTLASVSSVNLSSYGPADIQSSRVSCTSQDLALYVFIPLHSNHLVNLEQRPTIVAATDEWELQGNARLPALHEIPAGIALPGTGLGPAQRWVVVEIQPTWLTLHSRTGLGNIETIDF